MSDERAYRVHIHFEPDKGHFSAKVPELRLSASAETRAAVVEAIENAIDARVKAATSGDTLPRPVDVRDVDTKLELVLSQSLSRELVFQAIRNKITPEALALELVARGLGQMESTRMAREPARTEASSALSEADREGTRDGGSSDRGRGRDRDRGPRRGREGYRPELDDKANFLEYLRGLEKSGAGGGGSGGRGRHGR